MEVSSPVHEGPAELTRGFSETRFQDSDQGNAIEEWSGPPGVVTKTTDLPTSAPMVGGQVKLGKVTYRGGAFEILGQ